MFIINFLVINLKCQQLILINVDIINRYTIIYCILQILIMTFETIDLQIENIFYNRIYGVFFTYILFITSGITDNLLLLIGIIIQSSTIWSLLLLFCFTIYIVIYNFKDLYVFIFANIFLLMLKKMSN